MVFSQVRDPSPSSRAYPRIVLAVQLHFNNLWVFLIWLGRTPGPLDNNDNIKKTDKSLITWPLNAEFFLMNSHLIFIRLQEVGIFVSIFFLVGVSLFCLAWSAVA